MKTLLSIALLVFVANVAIAADNMKAFPPAEPGMVRYVIELPPQEDETTVKVELIVGKTVSVDAHNRYFFGGKIEKETIKGWGFDRYMLRKLGPMAGTLMAVDPNAPKVERFVTLVASRASSATTAACRWSYTSPSGSTSAIASGGRIRPRRRPLRAKQPPPDAPAANRCLRWLWRCASRIAKAARDFAIRVRIVWRARWTGVEHVHR